MNDAPPSAWRLSHVVGLAQSVLTRLRDEDGLILDDDASILAELSAGGVDVEAVLVRLVRATLDARANAAAARQRIGDLTARQARFERQEQALRDTLLAVMQAVEIRTWRTVEATLSVRAGVPKLYLDEAALSPDWVDVVTTYVPAKARIKAALAAGQDVPGAVMSNAAPVLSVRSS